MILKQLFGAVPVALLFFGNGAAKAGQIINELGAFGCVSDKWDVKEAEKGHKLVDSAGRQSPRRSSRTEIRRRLRRKIRVHARWKLEGRRNLHANF